MPDTTIYRGLMNAATQTPTDPGARLRALQQRMQARRQVTGQPTPPRYNQPFIEKYIFPGGHIPALSQVMPSLEEAGFILRDVEILTLHYAKTLREWRRRFHARWDEIAPLGFDARFRRLWDYYLAYCEAGFRERAIDVGLYTLTKPEEPTGGRS